MPTISIHADKIVFMKNYFMDPEKEYLVVYGEASSGKFHNVQQAYNILEEDQKNSIYLTIIRDSKPTTYGNKTAPVKKYVFMSTTFDAAAKSYAQSWNAEVVEFLADPIHRLHTIRNYDVAFRKWLRIVKIDSTDTGSPLLDMIALRDEYITINYDICVADTVVYNCGVRKEPISVVFGNSTLQFAGFSKVYTL
jgi:hypothetical protein